jgi:hypothetical protein
MNFWLGVLTGFCATIVFEILWIIANLDKLQKK